MNTRIERDTVGLLDGAKAQAIVAAADEVRAGQHPDKLPLVVWQTGPGRARR